MYTNINNIGYDLKNVGLSKPDIKNGCCRLKKFNSECRQR